MPDEFAWSSRRAHIQFASFLALSLILAYPHLWALFELAMRDERYTYILLAPAGVLLMIFWVRFPLGPVAARSRSFALLIIAAGGLLYGLGSSGLVARSGVGQLSVTILSICVIWTGGAVLNYGSRILREAAFPLFFLFLMTPPPTYILDAIGRVFQLGSAEVCQLLFRLSGAPVFRQDVSFFLPGVTIEVAEQCSGIRSGMSLLMTSLLISYLFLQSGWARLSLILLATPIIIVKNAIRIVAISLLGVYVDRGFLSGPLHTSGGLPFSLIAIAALVLLILALQKFERRPASSQRGFALRQPRTAISRQLLVEPPDRAIR
jgi:exosortase